MDKFQPRLSNTFTLLLECTTLAAVHMSPALAHEPTAADATNQTSAYTTTYQSTIDEVGLWLSAGVGIERFDTNFTFTDKETGLGGIIDAEGTLGMPKTDTVPFFLGGYAFNAKHAFEFGYWRINRDSKLLDIDKTFGDVSIKGTATLSDRTQFLYLNYGYSLYRDPRALVRLRAGLYGINLEYELDAVGSIEIDGVPVTSGEYNPRVRQVAPLPLIGIDFSFRITDRWSASSQFGLVGGSYKEISATVIDAMISARYAMTDHWGITLGANFLSADIDIDKEDLLTEVSYGFEGLNMSVDYNF